MSTFYNCGCRKFLRKPKLISWTYIQSKNVFQPEIFVNLNIKSIHQLRSDTLLLVAELVRFKKCQKPNIYVSFVNVTWMWLILKLISENPNFDRFGRSRAYSGGEAYLVLKNIQFVLVTVQQQNKRAYYWTGMFILPLTIWL